MPKFKCEQSQARLQQVRQLLKHGPMTVSEVATKIGISKPLTTHYVRHLLDQGVVKQMGVKSSGLHNAPANLWGLDVKPAPKPRADKARITKPASRPLGTLTNWIGGNPFERITA